MLGTLFILTALAVITAHYFLVERPRQRAAPPALPPPLSAAMGRLPKGVFLQPTYTWSRIRPSGELLVGVHPLLLNLVGTPYKLEVVAHGGRVNKGAPLIRIGKGDRCLTLHSPVTGSIRATKPIANGGASWDPMTDENGDWLCLIEAERLAEEVPTWMIADRALEWTSHRFGEIRDHLLMAGTEKELSVTLADGGELPVGILAEFDEEGWEAFQSAFLDA